MAQLVEVLEVIPGIYTHLAVGTAALVIGVSGSWAYLSQHYGLKIEQLKHQVTSKELSQSNQAVKDMAGFQKGFNDALKTFHANQQANTVAQASLQRLLVDLRGTSVGLRSDFSSLPGRITEAAKPALADFSEQCVAVFQSMADAGGQLAERGAEIARKADEHAANERLIHESWPKRTSR